MSEYFFSVPASINKDNFTATVYGGGVLFDHPQWRGGVIFDLASTTLADNTPVLLNHDRDKESGFSNSLTIKDGAIVATGKLLDNESGNRIKDNAEQGFKWQLSPHIIPRETYQLKKGETAVINGLTVEHPVVIFKNNTVREISFTPVGVDSTTSATIFNLPIIEASKMEDENTPAPAASLLSKIAAMLQLAPDASEEDVLTAVKTLIDSAMEAEESSRDMQLKEAFALAGKTYDKSKAAHYFSMPSDTFAAVVADLSSIKPVAPQQVQAKPLPANLFHLPATSATAKTEPAQPQSFDAMSALETYNKGAK
jgi:hypothetical protein